MVDFGTEENDRFYQGRKSIIITEINDFGGSSTWLGWFFVLGCIMALLAQCLFLVLYVQKISGMNDYYNPDKLSY